MTRNLERSGLKEGTDTRLLVHATKQIADGVNPVVVFRCCIAEALTDDADIIDDVLRCK